MARLFDGVGDEIDINDALQPVGSPKALTIFWWHKADHNVSNKNFLGPLDASNNGYRIFYGTTADTGRPMCGVRINGNFKTIGGRDVALPTTNEWSLFCWQFRDGASSTSELYVNDMDIVDDFDSSFGNGAYDVATPSLFLGSWGTGSEYDGELGPFIMFDGFFNAAQRNAVKDGRLPMPPRLYYRNEFASSTEPDYSGNGKNGTVTGTTRTTNPPVKMITRLDRASFLDIIGGAVTKLITDTLSLSHSTKTTKTIKILDTITQSEIIKNTKSIILSDSLSLSHSLKFTKLIKILQTINITENLTFVKNVVKIITDSLGLSESVKTIKTVAVSDAITISEIISKTVSGGITKLITDTLSLSHSIKVSKLVKIQETISISQSVILSKLVKISDTIGLTQLINAIKTVSGRQTLPLGNFSGNNSSDLNKLNGSSTLSSGNFNGDKTISGDFK